jgi:Zn-dependent protease
MALVFGDRTAEYEGRLTLNPIKHVDIFGTILLPLLLFISHAGFMIGWAKPVPYNPYNLKNAKIAEPLVAFAGPLSNILIAIIFGLLIRFIPVSSDQMVNLVSIFSYVVLINIALAIFNLIPIPPLDGSKILFSFLPVGRFAFTEMASRYGLLILIVIVAFLPNFISPMIFSIFHFLTGIY